MNCPDTFGDLMALWGRETPAEDPGKPVEPPIFEGSPEPDEAALMLPPASHEAIERAAQRWNEFVSVTQGRCQEEVVEAGYVFAAALGLEGSALDHAIERLKFWTDDPSPHEGTMGLLFGLLIAEEAKLERELEGPDVG